MDKQIKVIKRIWKTGATALVVLTMLFGGLFLNLRSALATNPNLTLLYLGNNNNDSSDSWDKDVSANVGEYIQFYAEIHNTNVPTTANNVKIKVNLPPGSGSSSATVSADNASSVSDSLNIQVNGGGTLEYVTGSTELTWDVNGDGTKEFDHTPFGDGIVGSGIVLGNQQGCNQYIIQVTFLVKVVAPQASPSPTPTPTPTPTPAPPSGGQNQEQSQSQTQNNEQNQTVNVTNTNTNTVNVPAVQGVSVPLKQPDTGVSVLGLTSIFGAAPVGIALSRFGKGRKVVGKREEESLAEIAFGLVNRRSGKSQDA